MFVFQGVVSMDCEKANKGLFTGLLVAVVTLIAIATFFVFDSRLNNPVTAIKVRDAMWGCFVFCFVLGLAFLGGGVGFCRSCVCLCIDRRIMNQF